MPDETHADDSLDLERAIRLDALAEEYRHELESGSGVSPQDFADRHPEVRDELLAVLRGIAILDGRGKAPEPFDKGRTVGPYTIRGQLGRGGMGIVYEAVESGLGRVVALKVLDAGLTDAKFRSRFQREARAAARLDHPGIVPVFGSGEDGDALWYAMRRVEGVALDAVLDALTRPPESLPRREAEHTLEGIDSSRASGAVGDGTPAQRAAATIAMQVAEALAYAHAEGVLHRDVKPGNVMLDRDGAAVLTDFGLCKVEGDASLTADTDIVGTLRYLPPEALSGRGDARGDVYGLGLVLYELLARQPAFAAGDRATMIQRVLNEDPPSLHRVAPDVPEDLVRIVVKATSKLPAERYATAEDLAEDLAAFLSGQPVKARAPSALYVARLFVRRNRPLVVAMVATFLVLVAGVIGTSIGFVRAVDAREVAEANEQRANAELVKAEQVTAFLQGLLEGASPWVAAGRDSDLIRELLDEAAAGIGDGLAGQHEAEILIRGTIGSTYRSLNEIDAAALHLERALNLVEEHLAADDPIALDARRNAGWLALDQGDPDRATELFDEIRRLRPLDEEVPSIDGLEDLAGWLAVLRYRFEYESILSETESVLPAALATHGPEERAVQTLREMRADSLVRRSLFEEGAVAYRELLDGYRKQYGQDHPYTLMCLAGLGHTLRRQGKFDEAEPFYAQALESTERIFGPDHVRTVTAKNNMALLLRDLGKIDESIVLLEDVVLATREQYGDTHTNTLTTLFNLGGVYEKAQRWDDSVATMQERYELHVEGYGAMHEQTLLARVNLGLAQMHCARVRESLANYKAAVDAARTIDGFDVKFLGYFVLMYSQGLNGQKRHAEAEPFALEAWDIFIESYGEESPMTRDAALTLVLIYEGMGSADELANWRGIADEIGAGEPERGPGRGR